MDLVETNIKLFYLFIFIWYFIYLIIYRTWLQIFEFNVVHSNHFLLIIRSLRIRQLFQLIGIRSAVITAWIITWSSSTLVTPLTAFYWVVIQWTLTVSWLWLVALPFNLICVLIFESFSLRIRDYVTCVEFWNCEHLSL